MLLSAVFLAAFVLISLVAFSTARIVHKRVDRRWTELAQAAHDQQDQPPRVEGYPPNTFEEGSLWIGPTGKRHLLEGDEWRLLP